MIVWNDPINLMSYVTLVLQQLFGFSRGGGDEADAAGAQRGQGRRLVGDAEKAELDVVAPPRPRPLGDDAAGLTAEARDRATTRDGALPRCACRPRSATSCAALPAQLREVLDAERADALPALPARVRRRRRGERRVRAARAATSCSRASSRALEISSGRRTRSTLNEERARRVARRAREPAPRARDPARRHRGELRRRSTRRTRTRRASRSTTGCRWLQEEVVQALSTTLPPLARGLAG